MTYMYRLVTPSSDIIQVYNSYWSGVNTNACTELFAGAEPIFIKDYVKDGVNGKLETQDKEIAGLWKNRDVKGFLSKTNSVYHTRVPNINALCEKLSAKDIEAMNVQEFLTRTQKITRVYAYSFATKVYSFVAPAENPIIDSKVSTLLWEYISQCENLKSKYPRREWGDYDKYKAAYNAFLTHFGISDKTYKDVDIFLWTYAVAMQSYWAEQGVLSFKSVGYASVSQSD